MVIQPIFSTLVCMTDLKKFFYAFTLCLITTIAAQAQTSPTLQMNPWRQDQLMDPESLASIIDSHKQVSIYNIGVVQNIKGAVNIGAASDPVNLTKLKTALQKVPKNQQIVIYCGCCPMGKCPNVRPAFQLLSDMKFKNVSVLDLHTNLKTDWIAKGYPIE